MFTGLIREEAEVVDFSNNILTLKASYRPEIGDSIAINGACLTVIALQPHSFSVELSKESRELLALENYRNRVHMEPAMQLGERIEGHLIQGHIDGVATVLEIRKSQNAWDFYLSMEPELLKYMMPKGSIAVDGVSLTINEIYATHIRLTIIAHTMKNTLFSDYKVGQRVNIETDMFARYIYHMLHPQEKPSHSWDEIEQIQALF